ncbi:MAG: amidohydrolase family protein [Candidatus Brocadiaceae bacterium]|nr:amidohydrolase family protein [Candidatus Brocadiaceae bacterium]
MPSASESLCDRVRARRPLPLDGIVDMHIHLGSWAAFAMPGNDADSMVRQMDRVGVAVAVCSHQACMTPEVAYGNDQVLEAMRRHPGRILGYASAYPVNDTLGIDEIRRCLDAGMVGVKMHNANRIPYTAERYTPIWRLANERRLPVLLHTWGGLGAHERLFEEYTDCPILLAHSGSTRADDYVPWAVRYPHVYLDLEFSGCPNGLVECLVRRASAEKIVFGSDMPWMPLGQQIGRVVFADIAEEQKRAILVDNARRILGLAP